MVRRELSKLAIYSICQEMETMPLECLRHLYLNRPSETVYIVKEQKLYGIVTMGEVLYGQKGNELVKINKSFTALKGYEAITAYKIFRDKPQIQKLPVVNEKGELIGDYSRWDDALYIKHNQDKLMQKEIVQEILEPYEAVYVMQPAEQNNPQYVRLIEYLDCFEIPYLVVEKNVICEKLTHKAVCIFIDEDERRGTQCLYGLAPRPYDSRGHNTFRYDYLVEKQWQIRLATYKSLLLQIQRELQLKKLKIGKPEKLLYDRLDKKATVLLDVLSKHGIGSFCVSTDESEETEYGKNFQKDIYNNIKENTWRTGIAWEETPHTEAFYGELLQVEDYKKGKAQREILYGDANLGYKENFEGKYYNIVNGKRATCYQPMEYIGTIYFVGLCVMAGAYVEDQYTIASCLQKSLMEKGFPYRVENYGVEMRFDLENRLEEIGAYGSNDLVIFHSLTGEVFNVPSISLERIFEVNQIPSFWVKDAYGHCNHKASGLIADSLLELIKPRLNKGLEEKNKKVKISFRDVMKTYVKQSYLDLVFTELYSKEADSNGAVVIGGGLFNKGHRHLIEEARKRVDFLIVFVLEENTFLFPFEERMKLVKEGTKDIDNIMIVPSGDFILSRNNFPEYYSQQRDRRTVRNAEYDANVFAKYIAEPLHITHRFAEGEPEGKISKIYHETMGRVLSQRGISFVEIPRAKIEGESVRSALVEKYLECGEYDKAFRLLPDSTKRYLMAQMNRKE